MGLVIPWVMAGLAFALAGWGLLRPRSVEVVGVTRFYATPRAPEPPLIGQTGASIAISPDARAIVYIGLDDSDGERRLYLRRTEALSGRRIAGTDGASMPVFSPDGRWIAFLSEGRLRKVPVDGGSPLTIAQVPGDARGMHWGVGDLIVFNPATGQGLLRVSANGGDPEPVTTLGDDGTVDHRWPFVLPDGKGVLFTVFAGAPERAQIAVASLETGEVTEIGNGTAPLYVGGYIVFGRMDAGIASLLAAPFDLSTYQMTGSPVPVLEGVFIKTGGAGEYHVSPSGSLVYLLGDAEDAQLVFVDRNGTDRPLGIERGDYHTPRFSPDGRHVALIRGAPSGHDVWVYDDERSVLSRLTFDGTASAPLWSSDGTSIAFASRLAGAASVYRTLATGGDLVEPISESRGFVPGTWLDNDSVLIVIDNNAKFWELPIESSGEPSPWAHAPFIQSDPVTSPDGRWVAFTSNETGQGEVYVRARSGQRGQQQISTNGGEEPVWASSGRELFYRSPEAVVVVPVELGETFRALEPRALFSDNAYDRDFPTRAFDVHPNGDTFVMVQRSFGGALQLVVVIGWLEEVRRRATGQ